MKKLLIILAATALVYSASASPIVRGGRFYHSRPHVVVSAGVYSPFYPYYSYPFYPYPAIGYAARPTRLELKIEDIQNDYKDKIWSARHDKSLGRQERKSTVQDLKHERDQGIIDTKRDYYKLK
jgi:hypothetical protein